MVNQGYRKTDIGIIPDEWSVIKVKDIVTVPLSYGVNSAAVEYDSNLPQYIRITDITDDGRYDSSNKVSIDIESLDKYTLSVGDILFARTGASTGKTYLYTETDGKLIYAGFLIRASIDTDKYDPYYVFLQFHTPRYYDWVSVMSTRSGQPGINGKEYGSYQLPMPSLDEQKAIATALSDIDALIANLEKLIAKKKAIKQGTMQELLTGKRRLPGFNGEWVELEIGKNGHLLRESIDPQTHPNVMFSEYSMPAFDDGQMAVKKYGADMHSNRTVIYGTILLFNKLNVRQKRIWLVNATEDNAVCSSEFLPYYSEAIDLRLLQQLLSTEKVTNDFIGMSTGTSNSQKRITPKNFLEYTIYVPEDIREQAAIAEILADMDKEIHQLQKSLNKYQLVKQGMMSELLTGHIRLIDKEDM